VEFVVGKVELGGVFSRFFGFIVALLFHLCSIFFHVSSGGWTVGLLVAVFPENCSLTPL
jgi:hypothetical protein